MAWSARVRRVMPDQIATDLPHRVFCHPSLTGRACATLAAVQMCEGAEKGTNPNSQRRTLRLDDGNKRIPCGFGIDSPPSRDRPRGLRAVSQQLVMFIPSCACRELQSNSRHRL